MKAIVASNTANDRLAKVTWVNNGTPYLNGEWSQTAPLGELAHLVFGQDGDQIKQVEVVAGRPVKVTLSNRR